MTIVARSGMSSGAVRRVRNGTSGAVVMAVFLATATILATPGFLLAQAVVPETIAEPITLSMRDAVRTALSQSLDIQDAYLALEEAEERVSEAWSNVMPSVDFSGRYTRNIAPAVSFLPAQFFGGEEGDYVKVQFGQDNAWASSFVLDQPLFEGQAIIGVGAAARYKGLQEEVLRGRAQDLVTRVRLGYYSLLLAQEEFRLITESVDRVRGSLEETEAMNRAGIAADYDVLRLQVELANLVPNLRRAENAVAQARRQLAIELNLEELEDLEVTGSLAAMDLERLDENNGPNREILEFGRLDLALTSGMDEVLDLAMAGRSDLKQLELSEKLRTAELRAEQAEFFPKISLFANYSINAQQNGSPMFFGDENSRATSKWVGVSVSLPIFTGFRRTSRIDQKRALLNQARNQSLLARLQAEGQVKSVREQAEEALDRARGQHLAVEQAQRGFEIASAQYREGLSSQLERRDAEVALRQSEFNYAQAVYDFLVFQDRLDEAVGQVPMVDDLLNGRIAG
ncbi:MAG: TolC family protein [Longimicrobiales bacterium]|nr:TolC family protein [Longimicrobiales bacterium]